jgi:hypothetical protein
MHPATPRRPRGGQPQQTAAVRQTRKPPLPGALRLLSSPLASFLSPLLPTTQPYRVFTKFQIFSSQLRGFHYCIRLTPSFSSFWLTRFVWVGASEMAAAKSPRGARDAGTRGLALQPRAGPDLGSSRA